MYTLPLGSGKTLAYLSPLVSHLRDEEERLGLVPRMRRPRALVLLPSRDLAAQVLVSGEMVWETFTPASHARASHQLFCLLMTQCLHTHILNSRWPSLCVTLPSSELLG